MRGLGRALHPDRRLPDGDMNAFEAAAAAMSPIHLIGATLMIERWSDGWAEAEVRSGEPRQRLSLECPSAAWHEDRVSQRRSLLESWPTRRRRSPVCRRQSATGDSVPLAGVDPRLSSTASGRYLSLVEHMAT